MPTEVPLMFQMDIEGRFYAHEKIRATSTTKGFHHSTFTGATGVAFAGTIQISEEGIIEWISDDSGHFRPLSEALISVLNSFESKEIPIEKIHLQLRRNNSSC